MLSERERNLLRACIERYEYDLRKACEQDQGTPAGYPGTVGHEMQLELAALRERIQRPDATQAADANENEVTLMVDLADGPAAINLRSQVKDGRTSVELWSADCDLRGEAPGVYYPEPFA